MTHEAAPPDAELQRLDISITGAFAAMVLFPVERLMAVADRAQPEIGERSPPSSAIARVCTTQMSKPPIPAKKTSSCDL